MPIEGARRNFTKSVTSVDSAHYKFFKDKIQQNYGLLKDKRIVIFGSGVLGNYLVTLLERYGFSDIVFCDNNEKKWNGFIGKYPILSPKQALEYDSAQVFLLPNRNDTSIRIQLLDSGLDENSDFLNWRYNEYDDMTEEFLRMVNEPIVFIGDSSLPNISVENQQNACPSMKDSLHDYFGSENLKVITMYGAGLPSYYFALKTLVSRDKHIKKLILTLPIRSFGPTYHNMPDSALPELVERFYNLNLTPEQDFTDYLQSVKEKYNRIRQSNIESNLDNSGYKDDVVKNQINLSFKMNYMYTLKENTEGFRYLKKTLELMKQMGIPVALYIPPVNYHKWNKIWPDFNLKYTAIIKLMRQLLEKFDYGLLDASFFLEENDFFVIHNGYVEIPNYQGNLKLLELFKRAEIMRITER